MTIRTACSSGLVGLNEACMAIAKGDCTSAIIGGTSIIMAPALMTAMPECCEMKRDTRLVGHHLLVFLSDGMYDLLMSVSCQ